MCEVFNTSVNVMRTIKIVILGQEMVGKSSLILRSTKNHFNGNQMGTVGAAFATLRIPQHECKFEIWDTAGQERYQCLVPMYYRQAEAAIVVFDITDQKSFERAKFWITELQSRMGGLIYLVGNKVDLAGMRCITKRHAKGYADENGLVYWETSAKDNINVTSMFEDVALRLSSTPVKERDDHTDHLESRVQLRRWICC